MQNEASLKQGLNQKQNPQSTKAQIQKSRSKKFKAIRIILAVIILLVISGGVGTGAYLLGKESVKKENDEQQTSEDNTVKEETVEANDSADDSNKGQTEEPTSLDVKWTTCVYNDVVKKITFRVQEDWKCIQNYDNPYYPYEVLIESEKINIRVGFLYTSGCDNPEQNCETEELYKSEDVEIYRILNDDSYGSTYANLFGSFFINGERIRDVGISITSPALNDRTFTSDEKTELELILDNLERIEELDSTLAFFESKKSDLGDDKTYYSFRWCSSTNENPGCTYYLINETFESSIDLLKNLELGDMVRLYGDEKSRGAAAGSAFIELTGNISIIKIIEY